MERELFKKAKEIEVKFNEINSWFDSFNIAIYKIPYCVKNSDYEEFYNKIKESCQKELDALNTEFENLT